MIYLNTCLCLRKHGLYDITKCSLTNNGFIFASATLKNLDSDHIVFVLTFVPSEIIDNPQKNYSGVWKLYAYICTYMLGMAFVFVLYLLIRFLTIEFSITSFSCYAPCVRLLLWTCTLKMEKFVVFLTL